MDLNFSKKNENSFSQILYLLTNLGLCKITINGRDEILTNVIQKSSAESQVCSFDVSDNGFIITCSHDYTVKIFDEILFNTIFQTYVSGLVHGTYLDRIYFANVICKNDKNKLIRRNSLANFFITTSKNEFIIFDLNQKNKSDLKKLKKKLEFGGKKGLSKRNSSLFMR
jgi:hypothetical protein